MNELTGNLAGQGGLAHFNGILMPLPPDPPMWIWLALSVFGLIAAALVIRWRRRPASQLLRIRHQLAGRHCDTRSIAHRLAALNTRYWRLSGNELDRLRFARNRPDAAELIEWIDALLRSTRPRAQ